MNIPEEIPVNLMQEDKTIEANANLFGPTSAEEIAEYDNRIRSEQDYTDLVVDATEVANAARNLYDFINRKNTYHKDESFDLTEHWDLVTAGVPTMWQDKFKGVASLEEALDLRDQIVREVKIAQTLQDNGIKGSLAMMTAGVLDVDVLVPFIGPAKKMALLARTARGAAYGAGVGTLAEGVLAITGETNDWSTVPTAMLMGAVGGSVVGGLVKERIRPGLSVEIVDDLARRAEFAEPDVNVLRPFEWQPDVLKKAADDFVENSVDPDALKALDDTDHVINEYTGARVFSGDEGSISERAKAFMQTVNVNPRLEKGWVGKMRSILKSGPLTDGATRLWNSGSDTARALAVSLFEFGDGLVVNNRSAAVLQEFLFGHTYKVLDQVYTDVVNAAFKRKGFGLLDFKAKAQYLKDLNREVLMAANDLRLGRSPKMSDEVKDIIAGIHQNGEKIRKEAAGLNGGRPVPGFETLQESPAYIPMPWMPDRLRAMLKKLEREMGSKKAARTRLTGAIRKAYMSANPDMEEAVADQVAMALVRRQLAKGDLEDTNIQAMLLNDDSRDLLKQAFLDNGVTEDVAEDLMAKIAGKDTDKGKISYARHRTDIDLSGEFDGIKIIDLVDQDLMGTMLRYDDAMTKRIALSRHGIDSKRKQIVIKTRIKKEMEHLGTADKRAVEEFIDHMFEYFEPGTVDKHINPWMRRAKATVNLSLLTRLGLTQSVETCAIIAETGMDNFVQASKVLKEAKLGKHKSELLDDLGFLLGNFAYERGLLRADLVTDTTLDIMTSSSPLVRWFDNILAKGQQMQSVVSGYTAVLEAQLNLGALATTNKIFRQLKAGKADTLTDMFESMGLDKSARKELQKLVDTDTIKFNPDGHVESLNLSQWSSSLREDYGLASLRLARQMTQKAFAGESIPWLHNSSWAIFGHLQTFSLVAMRKQFIRSAGRRDNKLFALATWGMGTAATAAIISALMEGTEDGLTAGSIARRAFSLNNAIGWTAPGIDLFAVMTGLEEYSPGGRYARDVSIPLLSVATRAQGIPEAMVGLIPGMEFDKSDKRAMQVVPVVGSMYFMGRAWDAVRTDND